MCWWHCWRADVVSACTLGWAAPGSLQDGFRAQPHECTAVHACLGLIQQLATLFKFCICLLQLRLALAQLGLHTVCGWWATLAPSHARAGRDAMPGHLRTCSSRSLGVAITSVRVSTSYVCGGAVGSAGCSSIRSQTPSPRAGSHACPAGSRGCHGSAVFDQLCCMRTTGGRHLPAAAC